jgi:hypothetical protein
VLPHPWHSTTDNPHKESKVIIHKTPSQRNGDLP